MAAIIVLIILYLLVFAKIAKRVKSENDLYIFALGLIGMIIFGLIVFAVTVRFVVPVL